jgi:hypothetical protein
MENVLLLAKAYRQFLLELGEAFKCLKDDKSYEGFAETFIDAVKSPEVGFSVHEVNTLIKMYNKFSCLPVDELPSHHSMKLMVNKEVDMELLESAKTLSVTDFKESLKDKELGTQERTYRYEIIKRVVETGNINKVYGEEKEIAIEILNSERQHV